MSNTLSNLRLATLCMFCIGFTLVSCKKESGQGGTASISGNVFADTIFNNKNNDILGMNQYLPNINVYLCYGDDTVANDNSKSAANGAFRFDYLQKGKYTLFVYSDNMVQGIYPTDNFHPFTVIKKQIEITERKQLLDAGMLHINYAY